MRRMNIHQILSCLNREEAVIASGMTAYGSTLSSKQLLRSPLSSMFETALFGGIGSWLIVSVIPNNFRLPVTSFFMIASTYNIITKTIPKRPKNDQ